LVEEERRVVGIITDRDLALGVLGSGGLDPADTSLRGVMSAEPVTCDVDADVDEVVRLMCEFAIRRIPITEEGRPVGLVTFDDLVVDGTLGVDALRSVVVAQLEVAAPAKPAGELHPRPDWRAGGPVRAFESRSARAEQTYNRMVRNIERAAALENDRARRAVPLVLCMICRRLTPQEARHLVAQVPSKLQPLLDQCFDGPDRRVTLEIMKEELRSVLDLDDEHATSVLEAVCRSVVDSVSEGQIDDVRGQLPRAMKGLFPALGSEPLGA
jgi:uncharacterized protein (DUF2267 family)